MDCLFSQGCRLWNRTRPRLTAHRISLFCLIFNGLYIFKNNSMITYLYGKFLPKPVCEWLLSKYPVAVDKTSTVMTQVMYICSTPKELDPAQYGVAANTMHSLGGILHVGPDRLLTGDLVALLEDLYCGPVAVEFQHLQVNVLSISQLFLS